MRVRRRRSKSRRSRKRRRNVGRKTRRSVRRRKGGRKIRRRMKRRNPRRRRRIRRRNPSGAVGSLKKPISAVTSGFNAKLLARAGTVVGGSVGNAWLTGMISNYLPGILATGIGNYAVGLGTAGLMGAAVSQVSPKIGGDVFFGGVLEVATRVVKDYVLPMIPMSGMGDYLTTSDAAGARPLGDYLTPANAATARPLGSYYGSDQYISEELAGL